MFPVINCGRFYTCDDPCRRQNVRGADGKLKDTKSSDPESTYATIYGYQFLQTSMIPLIQEPWARFPNVGLMAQQAEEYGSRQRHSN